MTRIPREFVRLLVVLIGLSLIAVGCSSGDDSGDSGPSDDRAGPSNDQAGDDDSDDADDEDDDNGGEAGAGAALGSMPDLEGLDLTVTFSPIDGCEADGIDGTVNLRFYGSGRGLAAGVSGVFDGTLHLGDGVALWIERPGHVTRNDVETTDVDLIDWTFQPDEVTGTWKHRVVDGFAETVGPEDGVCDAGGTFVGTSPDYAELFGIISTAPAIDQEVDIAEDLTCRATSDGFLMAGKAPALASGTEITGIASVEADAFVDLGEVSVVVGSDGEFEFSYAYEGGKTLVSLSLRSGVYSMGGMFFEECS